MLKNVLLAIACAATGIVGGCAHVDRARADYHQDKAERAARHGHFGKALREEQKSREAERDAERDPLP